MKKAKAIQLDEAAMNDVKSLRDTFAEMATMCQANSKRLRVKNRFHARRLEECGRMLWSIVRTLPQNSTEMRAEDLI
jgi:hypothetical protein